MRPEIKVSISSKIDHARKLALLNHDGIHVCSRWIHMAEMARLNMKPVTHWLQENFDDIESASAHIYYIEPGDKLRTGLGETFYALRAGKYIWVAGNGAGIDVNVDGVELKLPHRDVVPWAFFKKQIRIVPSIDVAFREIIALHWQESIMLTDGQKQARAEFWDKSILRDGGKTEP